MENKGCEFGIYNGLSYRICYGLTEDGKMDYSTPYYEFHKNCHCGACNSRFKYNEGPTNHLTVTTDNIKLFPVVEGVIKNYTCGENHYIGRKYISFMNGKVKEKII